MNKQETLESEDKLILGFAMVGIGAAAIVVIRLVSLACLALSGNMYMVR